MSAQSRPQRRRISRFQLLTAGAAGLLGLSAAPILQATEVAHAAGPDDEQNFVATGPASAGFDATATSSGTSVFSNGVATNGTHAGVSATGGSFGVLAMSPGVGVRGGGDNNSTGIQGISFADSTEQTHGSGTGVQGNSGTGNGVAGFSDFDTGVYGSGGGVSGVGVFGDGSTGVSGSSTTGIGTVGSSNQGTGVMAHSNGGVGLAATSSQSWAITAQSGNSSGLPAIFARSTATSANGGGGVHGESGHSFGVLGISSAKPTTFATGVGVVGQHANGYGAGVAGYSLSEKNGATHTAVPQSTGVFGAGDAAGVSGISAHGIGVRGANTASGAGIAGISFADAGQSDLGSGIGVRGTSGSGSAVAGFSSTGTGVYGQSKSTGVSGRGAVGVAGSSGKGSGVVGQTTSGAGVKGEAKSGIGVVATSTGSRPSIYAVSAGKGDGISATSRHGYGAEVEGGKAALRLVPTGHHGHPSSGAHEIGELVVDAAGEMFLCVKSGTPGKWRRIQFA